MNYEYRYRLLYICPLFHLASLPQYQAKKIYFVIMELNHGTERTPLFTIEIFIASNFQFFSIMGSKKKSDHVWLYNGEIQ